MRRSVGRPMNLGFYYHIPFARDTEGVVAPSNLGVTIEAFAAAAGRATFYGHFDPVGNEDFHLREPLVRTIDLGRLRSFPARSFMPAPDLRRFQPLQDEVDVMVIQGPTPLLPHLIRACDAANVPAVVVLVSSYATWRAQQHYSFLRNVAIRCWVGVYMRQQRSAIRNRLVFLQDPGLAEDAEGADRVITRFVPSLTRRTAAALSDVSRSGMRDRPIELLYSGRIVREKGVFEAVEAIALLRSRGIGAVLSIAGWEEKGTGMVEAVRTYAESREIADAIRFLGYLTGEELLDAYMRADIGVNPTYWDSLPRVVHEEMAVGLPVVGSNVGGLRAFLTDRENALLVEPRSAAAIADAIMELRNSPDLYTKLAARGQAWARAQTVEASAETMIDDIETWLGSKR